MITEYTFWKGPWHDVAGLIAETEKFYEENVTSKGLGDRFSVAQARIMEHRKWEPARTNIEANFDAVLRDLNVFYIPKQLEAGPCLVFPQQDIYGNYTHGKLRPLYELKLKAGPAKYCFLGKKENVKGPMWFGNTDRTLVNIGRTKSVLLVEGFFDLLACRLLMPDVPVLSTGTKSVNEDHIYYLQMLGVERVFLMFDNEKAKEGKEEGAGNQAMRVISAVYSKSTKIAFYPIGCPNDDPSMCLENYRSSVLLKELLQKIAA